MVTAWGSMFSRFGPEILWVVVCVIAGSEGRFSTAG